MFGEDACTTGAQHDFKQATAQAAQFVRRHGFGARLSRTDVTQDMEDDINTDIAPTNAPASPQDTPYQDFVIGPVATKPFWQEIDDTTGTSGNGMLLSNAFFKPPPPNGVGMECSQGGENSYAEVTVKSGQLKVAYKDQNGNTLKDVDGTTNCGPYTLTH